MNYMSEELRHIKLFGNGTVKTRSKPYDMNHSQLVPSIELTEAQQLELKIKNTKNQRFKRAEDRGMTEDFAKFFTLTAPKGSPLRNDPRAFIKLVRCFLKHQGVNHFAYLQMYRSNNNEYHVHGLADADIDLSEWIELTGANPKDCYCEDMYGNQINAVDYIIRDCGKMPARLQAFSCSYKAVKSDSKFQVVNKDTGTIIADSSREPSLHVKSNHTNYKAGNVAPSTSLHKNYNYRNSFYEYLTHLFDKRIYEYYHTTNHNEYNDSYSAYIDKNNYKNNSNCHFSGKVAEDNNTASIEAVNNCISTHQNENSTVNTQPSHLKNESVVLLMAFFINMCYLFNINLGVVGVLVFATCCSNGAAMPIIVPTATIIIYVYHSMRAVCPYASNAPPFTVCLCHDKA